jgi:Fic family protein
MFVISSDDKIDYVAAAPGKLEDELTKLFHDIDVLLTLNLSDPEVLYFAAYIHLLFVKIHPFQDGNGRSARLLEKWFLIKKLGEKATAIPLEKNYYLHLQDYYMNLKKIGLDYESLDFEKAIDFIRMTARGLLNKK